MLTPIVCRPRNVQRRQLRAKIRRNYAGFCNTRDRLESSTGCRLNNDPTPKMWSLRNPGKFLLPIVYACEAGFWPLMRCFWLKVLHVYEIGVTPNFKFEFCNYTSLVLCDVIRCEQLVPNLPKKWKLSSVKLILYFVAHQCHHAHVYVSILHSSTSSFFQ